jgi:hypothetical protein
MKYALENSELFPMGFEKGVHCCGFCKSKKLNLQIRRLRLKANGETYQIRPSFVMPYMIGTTEAVTNSTTSLL